MNNDTKRLFWVVHGPELDNEIFETLGEVINYIAKSGFEANVSVAIVKHAYLESSLNGENVWNYEDLYDTFEFIKNIISFL